MPAKILVVEDNPDARAILVFLLREEEGFIVAEAEDGKIAFDLAAADPPDLVVTDLCMPNFNGIDLIKALREIPRLSQIPILVVTACEEDAVPAALAAGADATANKPFQLEALIDLIKELLLPRLRQSRRSP